MKFKTLLTINSALAFASGIACVLIPGQLLASYGIRLIPMGMVIYQFWGASLIGLGLLIWITRNLEAPDLQKKIALSLFITNVISCALAFRGQFTGANALGWSTVTAYLLLVTGYGNIMLKQYRARQQ